MSTNSTVNATNTISNVKEDTFVVLESTSPPMAPSSGLFTDLLEEINKLSKSGSLKDDGWPATGENFDDIFGRFDLNNRGKYRNPLSSESYSKIPVDNSVESHQTIFNMPTVPDNIPNSIGKTEFPPSNVNISPNGETNSQVNSSSTTEDDLVSPEDVWLTASEVLLSTQPTSSPPPSRPPPPRPGKGLKAERISPLRERQEKLERQQRKSEEEEGEWRYEQERERIRVREEKEREERRLEKERERIRETEEKEREERRLVKERETIAREIEREREEREREERIQEEREARAREIEREREEKEREERRLEKERETRAREIEREMEENRRVVARVNKEARDRAAIAARLKAERVKAERLAVEKVMSNSRERLGRVAVEKVQTGVREREASEVEAKQMAEKVAAEEREKEIRERSRIERHQIIEERAANALAEMHQREFEAQRVHTERHRIAQTVDVEIERWAAGKQGNLRALLSTLQYVLWPECGWQPVALTDLIMGASVKKVYRKATLFVHPDKVQQRGANLQQKYVAEKVFDILKEAWNKFNSEELF